MKPDDFEPLCAALFDEPRNDGSIPIVDAECEEMCNAPPDRVQAVVELLNDALEQRLLERMDPPAAVMRLARAKAIIKAIAEFEPVIVNTGGAYEPNHQCRFCHALTEFDGQSLDPKTIDHKSNCLHVRAAWTL